MPGPKRLVQAILAAALLLLYTATIGYMLSKVLNCAHTSGCSTVSISDGMAYIVTTVGGLVSALVIASLAVSTPNSNSTLSIAGLDTGAGGTTSALAWAYVAVWGLTGLAALVLGTMFYPNI